MNIHNQHSTAQHSTASFCNFFSVEENFFIIDSNHLDSVKSNFYGFSIQDSGIYDKSNITDEAIKSLNGNGAYIYVNKTDREIFINQDFLGCYGLYLYQRNDYFVLSNSFLRLSEYLRDKVRLTLNRDYASHFLMIGATSSMSFSETMINEIELLPRDCVIKIDVPSRKLETQRIYYHENTVKINSSEGIAILDNWFRRYTALFRNLRAKTGNISIDLSGGLDSRMSFGLMLKSGVNLNAIDINSLQGKGYTLEEDYEIASEIAKHFGFTLNNHEHFTGGELNCSLEDSLNIPYYVKMSVHKQLIYKYVKYEDKHFQITGSNGECIRPYWDVSSVDKFIEGWQGRAKSFPEGVREPLCDSIRRVLEHSIEEISERAENSDISLHLYRDTNGRSHFGTVITADLMINKYTISPLSDYDLHKLTLNDDACPDKNLLMAVIYTRYCPELLKFRFTKNDSINPDTIKFAQSINAAFPIDSKLFDTSGVNENFSIVIRDSQVSEQLQSNNLPLAKGTPQKYLKGIYDKTSFRKLFATCFDESIYLAAIEYNKKATWHPLAQCQAVIAVTKSIRDVMTSQASVAVKELESFAESDFVSQLDIRTDKFLADSERRKIRIRKIKTLLRHPLKVARKYLFRK